MIGGKSMDLMPNRKKKKVAEIVDSKLRSISTTIRRVRLKDIRILDNDENARYMTSEQMRVLVDNLKRDGNLTSVPLVIEKEKKLEAVSGNHRIQAAVEAGIEEAEVMVLPPDIS